MNERSDPIDASTEGSEGENWREEIVSFDVEYVIFDIGAFLVRFVRKWKEWEEGHACSHPRDGPYYLLLQSMGFLRGGL